MYKLRLGDFIPCPGSPEASWGVKQGFEPSLQNLSLCSKNPAPTAGLLEEARELWRADGPPSAWLHQGFPQEEGLCWVLAPLSGRTSRSAPQTGEEGNVDLVHDISSGHYNIECSSHNHVSAETWSCEFQFSSVGLSKLSWLFATPHGHNTPGLLSMTQLRSSLHSTSIEAVIPSAISSLIPSPPLIPPASVFSVHIVFSSGNK